MKKIILFFVLLINFCVFAQNYNLHDGAAYGFKIVPKESDVLSTVKGSPYLNSEFIKGAVLVDGKEPLLALIRYHVPEERMEVRLNESDSEVYFLPRNEKTLYRIGMDKYQLKKIDTEEGSVFGYFNILYQGDGVELLKKHKAEITEAVKARTGYERDKPAEIVVEEQYYLTLPDAPAKVVEPSHRKVKKSFDRSEITQYLKANKIKDERDLVSLAQFIDQTY